MDGISRTITADERGVTWPQLRLSMRRFGLVWLDNLAEKAESTQTLRAECRIGQAGRNTTT
jgi:hypothetical protein